MLFVVVCGVSGCTTDDPEAPEAAPTLEQQVVENCRTVQAAAEQFATLNDGNYPTDNTDLTPDSLTLIDLLPGGQMLLNPYSGERNSPVSGGANRPGDVGYLGFRCDATIGSFAITGVGETAGDRIVTIRRTCTGGLVEWLGDYTPKLDDLVIENCLVLQAAAEAYAAGNNGGFAPDLTTPNLEGNTLIDLLPNGELLVNPVTRMATEPSCRNAPRDIGEISYGDFQWLSWNEGEWEGYWIVGRGIHYQFTVTNLQTPLLHRERIVVEQCLLVRNAVEAWVADNNGVYPCGTWDVTPTGDTVIDYLPEDRLLLNPFWEIRMSPVDGLAAAAGQVGFVPQDHNGDGVWDGYMIEALGGDPAANPIFIVVYPSE